MKRLTDGEQDIYVLQAASKETERLIKRQRDRETEEETKR